MLYYRTYLAAPADIKWSAQVVSLCNELHFYLPSEMVENRAITSVFIWSRATVPNKGCKQAVFLAR